MIVYKWIRPDLTTRNYYQYVLGVPAEASGGDELCGPGWLHAYSDPLLAVMMRTMHVPDDYTVLYRCKAEGEIISRQDKIGATVLTLEEEVEPPIVTTMQHVRFGILSAYGVFFVQTWRNWADDWLSHRDRSLLSASRLVARFEANGVWAWAERSALEATKAAQKSALREWTPKRLITEHTSRVAAHVAVGAGDMINLAQLAHRAIAEEPAP